MDALLNLWQPILLSAVVVFFASFVFHTMLGHHNGDYKKLPGEANIIEAIRAGDTPPGQYIYPHCTSEEIKDKAYIEKMTQGPSGVLHVWDGAPNMARNLTLTFLYDLMVAIFVAYLASNTLAPGASYLKVFQITGTASIMAHCFAFLPKAIWFRWSLRGIVTDVADGVALGLLTAGVFGWLWPAAQATVETIMPAAG